MLEVVLAPVCDPKFVRARDKFATSKLRFGVRVREGPEQKEIFAGVTEALEFVAVGFVERLPPCFRVANEFRREAINESDWE